MHWDFMIGRLVVMETANSRKVMFWGDFLPKWAPILYKILLLAKYNFQKLAVDTYVKRFTFKEKKIKKCFGEQVYLVIGIGKGVKSPNLES